MQKGPFIGISLMKIESCLGTKFVSRKNVQKWNGLFGDEEKEEEEEKKQDKSKGFFAKLRKSQPE